MSRVDCAGLELVDGLDDGDAPIAAVAVIKVMTGDGDVGYMVLSTEGLTSVEALGMTRLAVIRVESALRDEDDPTD